MSAFIHIGQDYAAQVSSSQHVTTGDPNVWDDGINWPYDPNGNTPDPSQFQINWNDPNAVNEAEQAYERLLEWLKDNPGCYNGYIMLLQMTVDIGMHLGSLPPTQQQQLASFLSNQLTQTTGNETLLQMIIGMAAQGAAVSQGTEAQGEASAMAFLQAIANATGSLQGFGPPFTTMYGAALYYEGGISNWCQTHYETFTDPATGQTSSTWVDDNGVPISSFSQFANMAAFKVGLFVVSESNIDQTIDAYYEAEIEQLVAQFKGNPWALLVALMNLINQRDQDNGMSINGYGGNLNVLQQANSLIQKLLGDITGTPNAADFYSTLQQIRTLIEQDPAFAASGNLLITQLESDIGTINNQTVPPPSGKSGNSINWSVGPGYYNFPPNTQITYNGKTITVSGEVYLSGGNISISSSNMPAGGYTFGQLAAMGATSVIQSTMAGWSSTVMSNFENGVTGIQTLLNGASPAIQQQIQTVTQTMQAEENFEKEAFDSIINVNQQIMKLVQQVMG